MVNAKGSIVERKGRFYLVISQGVIDGKNKIKWVKMEAQTREEAEEEKIRINITRPSLWSNPKKITFSVFAEQYLQDLARAVKRGRKAENTYDWYESRLRNHIYPVIGRLKLIDVKARDLQNLYDDLYEESPTMADAIYRIIHAIWEAAVQDDDIDIRYNLADKIHKAEKVKTQAPIWTADQITYFLQHAKERRYYEFFLLGFAAGMRCSEILGLTWDDIDHKNMVINVRRAIRLNKKFDPDNLFRRKTKTANAIRTIRMIPIVSENLKLWKKAQIAEKLKAKPGTYFESDLVFTTKEGKPANYSNIRESYWVWLIDRLNNDSRPLPYMKIHSMRHSCATWLFAMGTQVDVIRDILGHSTTVITRIYAHADVSTQDTAMAMINDVFKKAGL